MHIFILFLLALLVAMPAGAFGWKDCGNTTRSKSMHPRSQVCGLPTNTDLTSDLLGIEGCENVDVFFNSDTLAASAASTCSVYNCTIPTANTNACNLVGAVTMTGVYPLNEFQGLGGSWLYAVCTHPGGGEVPVLQITCNP